MSATALSLSSRRKNIHIDEIAGVWLTPDVKFDRAEPKRALDTVVPRAARPASDVDVARGDVDVAAGTTSGAASSSAAAPAAPPARYVPSHTIGVDVGDLKPGELPILRELPKTSTVLHCRAKRGIFVFGDIEGQLWLKTIARKLFSSDTTTPLMQISGTSI